MRGPWYSSDPLTGLWEQMGSMADDLSDLWKGWRWRGPRPRDWPDVGPPLERPSDLGWARSEPVRLFRRLIQRGLLMPFTEAMTHPQVEGREWLRGFERPVILASNHNSHADTPLLLDALPDRVRDRTVVAAAEDYFYSRPAIGHAVSLWLNTFPFSRTGGAQAVLHSSSQLLRSGWNLLVYPEGTRSPDGRIQEFKAGVGHLAAESRAPVVPIHVGGSRRVQAKGRSLPLPAPVRIRVGKPLTVRRGEGARAFTARIEHAVRDLAEAEPGDGVRGTWIERWQAMSPRRSGPAGP
ncbi:MAG: lysophospholipid acyltransferase family protein [Candidatus Dormibacteraceae bacterium]